MNKEVEIAQNASIASHDNTFIGVQHNHGLTVNEAMEMALSLFREYYPQLKEEALVEIHRLVKMELQNIPSEFIVAPSPRIAVPTLQNASITEEEDVRVLYAKLLSNSMKVTTKDDVHPSYVEIIRQLTADEAKILAYMKTHSIIPAISILVAFKGNGYGKGIEFFTDVPERIGCLHSDDPEKCFNNLVRLGLVEKHSSGLRFPEETCNELRNHPLVKEARLNAEKSVREFELIDRVIERICYYRLTDFGGEFCITCV